MSWLYSRALVAGYSEVRFLGGEQYAPLRSNPMPQAFLSQDKMTAFSRLSQFGMTFAPLTENLGTELLTWYLAVFHVKTSHAPEKELEYQESEANYGMKCEEYFVKLDRNLRLWRTAQCSFLEDLEMFCGTWPKWGTMRNGVVYARQKPAHLIEENEFGLLPTPTACDHKGSGRLRVERGANNNLRDYFKVLYNFVYPPVSLVVFLMGWPEEWVCLKPLAMDKYQQWYERHGTSCAKEPPQNTMEAGQNNGQQRQYAIPLDIKE